MGAPRPPELVLLEEFRGHVVSGKLDGAGCGLEREGWLPGRIDPQLLGGLASKGRFELFLAYDLFFGKALCLKSANKCAEGRNRS